MFTLKSYHPLVISKRLITIILEIIFFQGIEMAQVILIENDETLNDLLSVNLTTYLDVDLIQRTNAQDVLSLLAILPNIELIITPMRVGDELTSEILENHILSNKLDTGLIVIGSDQKAKNDFSVNISDPTDWEKVITATAKILGTDEDVLAKKAAPDYIAVPVKYFLNLDSSNCDVFIRIKKSSTEYQYVKRIHKGDTFSKDSIKRYLEQGLENFYVPKNDHKSFAIFLSNRLVEELDTPDMDVSRKVSIMGESYEISIKEITKLGFNSENIQLMESIIVNMLKNFEKTPEMSNLLHKVINSEIGIIFQQTHMISIVACEILKNLNHNDPKAYEKIAYASFFHDITLADHEKLSKINCYDELEKANFNERDWNKVFNHAHEAAELIRKYADAPVGADEIIRCHHGTTNGKGFSNEIEKLPELAKIFIIAHHFVIELFRYKESGGEPRPVTEELYRRYPTPSVVNIIKALEKTLKKRK